ncbi:AlwI family type II restriction endonuclease [uncultured Eubacterium sp.]|uniref:AlwI family type II restriction endonuclease n=1 Tax=uncultured Eubacterium sp. TaxID=165185 RepID=UPI002673FB40|nr:AlwI family type II restriction endonuclease [uncultured Eubacterium sp.]
MTTKIGFKSYCWAIGTTSYRTDKFNMNIEMQMKLLKEFRNLPENKGKLWTGNNKFQAKYYEFLKNKEFVKGDAPRPDKDAREKTSGLRDIGLLDDERNVTAAGEALIEIAKSGDFTSDNLLEIPKDSYLYFKQLLKTSNDVDGKNVRPFVVFLYVVSKVEFLTYDEFTYLLPLCVDKKTTDKVIECVISSRSGSMDYEDTILSVLMGMENYQKALALLQEEEITEELICNVGINRKSAKYDKPYYVLYNILKSIVFAKDNLALELYEATKKLTNSKVGGAWRKYFFSSNARSVISRMGLSVLNTVPILQAKAEDTFNEEFFKIMHLFKAKATLSDYFDLNRRYFRITDIVLFEDDKVKLDVLPKCYIENIADDLLDIAFEKSDLISENVKLETIHPCLAIDADRLYQKLGRLLGKSVTDKESARKVIKDERYARFNKLIDDKFDKDTLITLFDHFESRHDDEIRALVTDNADIPTVFEYVLGIAWYVISDREGDVLDYMNLSLEADLLPKTHAGGGEADIVWKYEKTDWYPKHTLLIEATLADGSNQRRMEMEPVSRHLGEYCITHPEDEAYCVFVTTYLNINVISDFRARRYMEYYNTAGTDYITGMKILPIQTSELKTLLRFDVRYPQIYKMLDKAYNSSEAPREWYENNIVRETSFYNVQEI